MRTAEPPIGYSDQRTSEMPNLADSPATRISVAPSSSVPPAMAVPSTASDDRHAGTPRAQQRLPRQVGIGGQAALHVDLVDRGVALVPAGHLLEVGARAEVAAGAGEDQAADVVVRVGLDARVVEAHEHLAVDGVLTLGTVEGDDQRVTVAFGEHSWHRRRLGRNENAFYFWTARRPEVGRTVAPRPAGLVHTDRDEDSEPGRHSAFTPATSRSAGSTKQRHDDDQMTAR